MQRLNYDKANPPLYERGVIRTGVDERFNHGALLFLLRKNVNFVLADRLAARMRRTRDNTDAVQNGGDCMFFCQILLALRIYERGGIRLIP